MQGGKPAVAWQQLIRVCSARQNFYVFCLYRKAYRDYKIYECLQALMAAVQAEDVRASFLFMGDLNGHHQKWLGSTKVL